jgi:tetratricopeptide (TPR) repeat protein
MKFLEIWSPVRNMINTYKIIGLVLLTAVIFSCSGMKQVKKESPPTHNKKAWQYFSKGNWDEFEFRYEDALLNYYMASSFDSTNSAIFLAIAENEMRLEVYDVALIYFNKALKYNPKNIEILEKKATALTKLKNFQEAYEIYKNLLKNDPEDTYYQFMCKNLITILKSKSEELWYYEFLAQEIPSTDIQLQLAKYYFSNDKVASAQELLEKLYQREPENLEVSLSLVDCYNFRGWNQQAIDLLEKILQTNSDIHLLYKLMELYGKTEQGARSIAFLEKYLKANPDSREVYIMLSDSYLRNDHLDKCLKTLDAYRQVETGNKSSFYFEIKARAYMAKYDMDSTQTAYIDSVRSLVSEGLTLYPKDHDLWMLSAFSYTQTKEWNNAISVLQKAEPKFPKSIRLLTLHSQILFTQEKTDEARPILERLLQLEPSNRTAISFLATYYQGLEDYARADSLYREGIKYYPQDALMLNNYAYSLATRNIKLDTALAYIEIAIKNEPENAAYLDTKGWILYQLKEYQQAHDFIYKAYQKVTDDKEVLEHYGDVLWQLGKKEEAKKIWKQALQQAPEDEKLIQKLEIGL